MRICCFTCCDRTLTTSNRASADSAASDRSSVALPLYNNPKISHPAKTSCCTKISIFFKKICCCFCWCCPSKSLARSNSAEGRGYGALSEVGKDSSNPYSDTDPTSNYTSLMPVDPRTGNRLNSVDSTPQTNLKNTEKSPLRREPPDSRCSKIAKKIFCCCTKKSHHSEYPRGIATSESQDRNSQSSLGNPDDPISRSSLSEADIPAVLLPLDIGNIEHFPRNEIIEKDKSSKSPSPIDNDNPEELGDNVSEMPPHNNELHLDGRNKSDSTGSTHSRAPSIGAGLDLAGTPPGDVHLEPNTRPNSPEGMEVRRLKIEKHEIV